MKRPLLTQLLIRIKDLRLKTFIMLSFVLGISYSTAYAQPVFSSVECFCLDNATTSINGQYRDSIIIVTGVSGQTWRLQNPIGFYNIVSLPPPAAPLVYLQNTIIPEDPLIPGRYALAGIRISGVPWTVTVTNGSSTLTRTATQSCSYPSAMATTIAGDGFVCPGSVEIYSIPANALLSNLIWSVPGAVNIAGQGTNSITVTWPATPGLYSVSLSGTLASYVGQTDPCSFSVSKIVSVTDPVPNTTIRGDFGNCIGDTEIYTIAATLPQLSGVVWTILDSDGMMPHGPSANPASFQFQPGGSFNSRTVVWPNTPGVYFMRVTGSYRPNINADFCPFSHTVQVDIVDEATVAMVCNNLVNMSMNPDCELSFEADFFLEAMNYPNSSYDIIITDPATGQIIPTGTLGYGYINKTLKIQVVHECSGNSCWGYARIEDKSIPDLECPDDVTITCEDIDNLRVTGFPTMPIGVQVDTLDRQNGIFRLRNFDKCSDIILTFHDVIVPMDCNSEYSSMITRTWRIVDDSGNTSTCVHKIWVLRATLDDLVMPFSYDNVLGPNPSLEACDNWPKFPVGHEYAGHPDPIFTGSPLGVQCLKASVSFTDIKIPICGDMAFKIRRRWRVIDHCDHTRDTIYNQFITVMDTRAPVITCPADLTEQDAQNGIIPAAIISVSQFSCGAEWLVLPPLVIFECSRVTWDVHFLLADSDGKPPVNGIYQKVNGPTRVIGNPPPFMNIIDPDARPFRIENLPSGRTWIRYTVTDECGNFSYCFTEVDVEDLVPPTPVCDKFSLVAVGADGMGFAGVYTFDDGSHDNCELDCLKVRRMPNPVNWNTLEKFNTIKFSCSDIGTDVMVELGVWDKSGNFNSCMVTARVQDNIPPVVDAPADITVNCTADFSNFNVFGLAVITDNCSFTQSEEIKDRRNECGVGIITRIFKAVDPYGSMAADSQKITVINNAPFNNTPSRLNDIRWPFDALNVQGCSNKVPLPDELPIMNTRRPTLADIPCSMVAATYEDIVFQYTTEACVKILRKWTVIDWCQRNPLTGAGIWMHTQVIMVNNQVKPSITFGCLPAHLTITQTGICQARVQVTATATDDCTAPEKLVWTYSIFDNNGTTATVSGNGNSIDRTFSYGTHKIRWFVKDECNNIQTCDNVFTILDDKKPTPYCISELVTVIMPTSKNVTIWASDFDLGGTDNCTPSAQLKTSFSTNVLDISRTISCSDMTAKVTDFSFNVYSTDAAGNSDFCVVNLRVQDNANSCGFGINEPDPEARISIRGSIYTDGDEMVSDVAIDLKSDLPEFPRTMHSGTNGRFSFENLKMYENYSIVPEYNATPLNGVSTLDLVMIQRHILGIQRLDSPYKLIAADVNNSQKVTAADLVELRKMILGIHTEFPNNKSWRFVDVAHQFQDAQHPFPFAEKVDMQQLDYNLAGVDFVAVKIGDVNGNAKANNLQNGNNLTNRSIKTLLVNSISGRAGDIVNIDFVAENTDQLVGLQLGLKIDMSSVQLVDIVSDGILLSNDHISYSDLENGVLNISWNNIAPQHVDGSLFKLVFKLTKDLKDSDIIDLQRNLIAPEIYTIMSNNVEAESITLRRTADQSDKNIIKQFELFQNIPNPFNAGTIIGFNLPEAGDVVLKVFDIDGKLRHQATGKFDKGYNTFQLESTMLNATGILYYQLETNTDSATRKMIVIK